MKLYQLPLALAALFAISMLIAFSNPAKYPNYPFAPAGVFVFILLGVSAWMYQCEVKKENPLRKILRWSTAPLALAGLIAIAAAYAYLHPAKYPNYPFASAGIFVIVSLLIYGILRWHETKQVKLRMSILPIVLAVLGVAAMLSAFLTRPSDDFGKAAGIVIVLVILFVWFRLEEEGGPLDLGGLLKKTVIGFLCVLAMWTLTFLLVALLAPKMLFTGIETMMAVAILLFLGAVYRINKGGRKIGFADWIGNMAVAVWIVYFVSIAVWLGLAILLIFMVPGISSTPVPLALLPLVVIGIIYMLRGHFRIALPEERKVQAPPTMEKPAPAVEIPAAPPKAREMAQGGVEMGIPDESLKPRGEVPTAGLSGLVPKDVEVPAPPETGTCSECGKVVLKEQLIRCWNCKQLYCRECMKEGMEGLCLTCTEEEEESETDEYMW